MKVKFKTYLELEVEVTAYVTPPCPPVPCSDPDHPAYSDPGDPGGVEIHTVMLGRKDITELLHDDEIKMLGEQAEEEARNRSEP